MSQPSASFSLRDMTAKTWEVRDVQVSSDENDPEVLKFTLKQCRATSLTLQTDLYAARVVIVNQRTVIEQRDRELTLNRQEHDAAENALCLRVSQLASELKRERAKLSVVSESFAKLCAAISAQNEKDDQVTWSPEMWEVWKRAEELAEVLKQQTDN